MTPGEEKQHSANIQSPLPMILGATFDKDRSPVTSWVKSRPVICTLFPHLVAHRILLPRCNARRGVITCLFFEHKLPITRTPDRTL